MLTDTQVNGFVVMGGYSLIFKISSNNKRLCFRGRWGGVTSGKFHKELARSKQSRKGECTAEI